MGDEVSRDSHVQLSQEPDRRSVVDLEWQA